MAVTDPNATPEPNETPDDVASLYSWANLHGAKYRDFSASRSVARDEAKRRVEEALVAEARRKKEEEDRRLQEEAQAAVRRAAEAAEAARKAEAERLAEIAKQAEAERQAVLASQEAQRQAQQRASQGQGGQAPVPAAGHPQTKAPGQPQVQAPGQGPTTGREMDWQTPVRRTRPEFSVGAGYAQTVEAEAGGQPEQNESYVRPAWLSPDPVAYLRESGERDTRQMPATGVPHPFTPYETERASGAVQGGQGEPFGASAAHPAPAVRVSQPYVPQAVGLPGGPVREAQAPDFQSQQGYHFPSQRAEVEVSPGKNQIESSPQARFQVTEPVRQEPVPQSTAQQGRGQGYAPAMGGDERVAEHTERGSNSWYALKSLFDPQAKQVEQAPSQTPAKVPVLAVFSLAGGVGKTSLVASLGRALSSRGERVLLVDTAAYGLLPFFFGARDQRPGVLRTFNPPGSSNDAPVQLLALDPESQSPEGVGQDWMMQEMQRQSRGCSRMLVDLPTASGATTRRILRMSPTVLVPVIPDMNSVVSVGAIEAFFRNHNNMTGTQAMPYYVLNQFDYSQPLHLDVREILREQIGDRLLPFALRRSAAVSEALAEGMTVIDYAPSSSVTEDYASLAGWVRGVSAAANVAPRGVRWSER